MLGFLPRLPAPSLEPARASALAVTTPLPALPLALETIETEDTFVAISEPASDLIANGRIAKFLIDRRDPADARVLFVNGNFRDQNGQIPNAARFHWFFGRAAFGIPESLADFNQLTYFTLTTSATSPARCTPTFPTAAPNRSTACSAIPRTSSARTWCSRRCGWSRSRSPFRTPGSPSCPPERSRP